MEQHLDQLVAEIRRHLREAPSGAMIDAVAVATTFAQRFDVSVDDIRNIVRVEAERARIPLRPHRPQRHGPN